MKDPHAGQFGSSLNVLYLSEMDTPTHPGLSGAFPDLPGVETGGTNVPGRELHLLIQGLRSWCQSSNKGDRAGSLITITGSAGSGKSLLIRALENALATLNIKGRSASCFRESLPFEPIRVLLAGLLPELLRSRMAGTPGGMAWKSIEPFAPELCRLLPEFDWPRPTKPFPSLGQELDQLRASDLAARAFVELSRAIPLVLVFEDLQWIDSLSREVLAALLRMARLRAGLEKSPRLLVIVTLRPEEAEGLEQILDPRTIAQEVQVRGYSREDIRDCAARAGIDLPPKIREALYRETGGNPLQVQFHLRGLRPGMEPVFLETSEDPAHQVLSFERGVQSRFAEVGELESRGIELLCCLGRPYPTEFVSRLMSLEPSRKSTQEARTSSRQEAEEALGCLLAGGWAIRSTLEDGSPAIQIAGDSIASVILQSIPETRKAGLHRVIGETLLEEMGPEGAARCPWLSIGPWSRIFSHLVRVPDHARRFEVGHSAAREAENLSSPLQAIEVYERLLEDLNPAGNEDRRIEIAEKLAGHLELAGIHREAVEIYRKLLTLDASKRKDDAWIFRKIGSLQGKLGERDLQLGSYREGLKVLEGAGENLERLKIYAQMARTFLELGDRDECQRCLQESMKLPGEGDLSKNPELLEIYTLLEEVRFRQGGYKEALEYEEQIFGFHANRGDFPGMLRSAERLGCLHLFLGDSREASQILKLGLEGADATGSNYLKARLLKKIGDVHRNLGEFGEAIQYFSKARDLFREQGRGNEMVSLIRSLLHLQLVIYDFPSAEESLLEYAALFSDREITKSSLPVFPPEHSTREARSLEIVRLRREMSRKRPEGERAILSGELAEILIDEGKFVEAGRMYREALNSFELMRRPVQIALLFQRSGRLHRLLGDRSLALQLFEKSLNCQNPVPQRALVGNAYLEVGSIFLIQGEMGKAYDYLLRGLRLFVDLEDDQGFIHSVLSFAEFFKRLGFRHGGMNFASFVVDICRERLGRIEARAQCLLGAILSEAGEFSDSDRCFRKAQSLLETLGLAGEEAALQLEQGWDFYRREEYSQALASAREGIEVARRRGAMDFLEDFLFLLGAVESALSNRKKNFLRALELLNQALLGAQSRGRPFTEAQILHSIALVYERRGKEELGREFRARARAVLDRIETRLSEPLRQKVHAGEIGSMELALELAR